MQSIEQIIRLQVDYHRWAIEEMWQGLQPVAADLFTRQSETSFGSLAGTLAHMYPNPR